MKKKRSKIMMGMLFLLLTLTLGVVPVQAAKRKAVKLQSKITRSNGRVSMTVRGLDSKGKQVWRHKTRKYPATELEMVKCVVRKQKVYIFAGSKLTVLRKTDGKKLWTLNNISPAGYVLTFDKSDNLYVTGYYENIIFKISRNGRILWKTDISKTGNYWPNNLRVSGKKLIIPYGTSTNPPYNSRNHRVILSTKTGKIISYK